MKDENLWWSTSLFYNDYKYSFDRFSNDVTERIGDSITYAKKTYMKGITYGVKSGFLHKSKGERLNIDFGFDIAILNRHLQERYKEFENIGEFPICEYCFPTFDSSLKYGKKSDKIIFGVIPNISINAKLWKNLWVEFPLEIPFFLDKDEKNKLGLHYWRMNWFTTFTYYF
jgi:hypothetical protein